MDVKTAGSLGGQATSRNKGKEHYQELGRKNGLRLKQIYGEDYFKQIRAGIRPSKIGT